jgi:hypothetical protein
MTREKFEQYCTENNWELDRHVCRVLQRPSELISLLRATKDDLVVARKFMVGMDFQGMLNEIKEHDLGEGKIHSRAEVQGVFPFTYADILM